MLLEAERALIVHHAGLLAPDGLVVGTAGNLSVRSGDLVAITPSSVDYDVLDPGLVCVVGLDGEVVDARRPPSSELPMHRAVYRATGATAIVHTHAPYATTLATVVDELPAIHYMIAELGGAVRVTPYATFGTHELADSVTDALQGRSAVLLGSHGTLTIGDSLEQAYARSVLLEWLAALYYRATLLGDPRLLPADEIELVAERLRALPAHLRLPDLHLRQHDQTPLKS
jgi:L-fuculose-phosphate aldolase